MGKRKLIYIPKLYPGTFVFFYQKGSDQTSFSIRDYSKTPVDERRGKTHFGGMTADKILQDAKVIEPAPTYPTTDEPIWRKLISEANIRYEKKTGTKMTFKIGDGSSAMPSEAIENSLMPGDLKSQYRQWKADSPKRADAEKSYFVKGHDGIPSTGGASNRGEEHLAMALFNSYRNDGKIIELGDMQMSLLDYQFPLKSAQSDKIGKVDLIGIDAEGSICVIELKAWRNSSDSPEDALWQALKYTAAVEANIADIRREKPEILHDKPTICIMAPSQYWELHSGLPLELANSIERELSIPVSFVKILVDEKALTMGLNGTKPTIDGTVSFETISRSKGSSGSSSSRGAEKGSQHQIQVLVNEYQELLDERISMAIPELDSSKSTITWVSPLQTRGYVEYKDEDFLQALGMGHLWGDLGGKFWPRSGPRWDALATVSLPNGENGVILVEAKSHPPEAYGGGCKAANGISRDLIEQSLETTKSWLHVDSSADWMGNLYQYGNRLAHLYFFREIAGVNAWLVNIYFADDPFKPTAVAEWEAKIPHYKSELGLPPDGVPHCVDLVIDAPSKV